MKKTIIFDFDDVIIKEAFFEILKEFVQIHLKKEITKEEIGSAYYYETEIFENDDENINKFYDYFLEKNMYDYGIIEEGTVELLEELSKTHEVIIFTSPILENREKESGILFKNKYEFLCKLFPFIPPNNFILGGNKSIIFSNYMIDDRVDNLTGNIDVKMLYSALHNLDISDKELYEKGIFRVSSMEEIRKVVYSDFSNVEIFNLVSRYLPCLVGDEPIICTKINITLDREGVSTLDIYVSSGIYQVSDKDEREKFYKFIGGLLGMKVNPI